MRQQRAYVILVRRFVQMIALMLVITCIAACGSGSTSTLPPTAVPLAMPVRAVAPTSSPPTATLPDVPPPTPDSTGTATPSASAEPPADASETPDEATDQVVGTVVRFSRGSTSVDVTIGEDSPAVRDFLAMLPLTLTLEEFAGREKIAYLPRDLVHAGSPGSDPEDGDLIYYIPWGNLGFYYNTAGVGYSDQTIHLGTYTATRAQLDQMEGQDVVVEIVR